MRKLFLAAILALATAAHSQVVSTIYNSSAPTVTTGQTLRLQGDANGKLRVSDTLTDGTNSPNYVAGDSGQNSVVTVPARKEVTFTTSTVQAVASTDVSNYSFVSVHTITQGGSSVVNFQQSNDNTNWAVLPLESETNTGANIAVSTSVSSTNHVYSGQLTARYFRLNVTGIASGTTAGVVEFFAAPRGQQAVVAAVVQTLAAPYLSTAVTNSSGNVAAATATAALPAVSGKTNYMTGFEITASGSTSGAVVSCTVVGPISGTMTYTYAAPVGVLVAATPLIVPFTPPIPSSTTNTAITVSCPSLGTGNTNTTVVVHGFTL